MQQTIVVLADTYVCQWVVLFIELQGGCLALVRTGVLRMCNQAAA